VHNRYYSAFPSTYSHPGKTSANVPLHGVDNSTVLVVYFTDLKSMCAEMTAQGHRRSTPMLPIERSSMSSHW